MKAINAAKAPAAVGPYVHAVQAGNTIYTSGQLGLIPETGELAVGVEAQAEQAFANVKEVLREAGCNVLGIASIFTYNLQKGKDRLAQANVINHSLSNFETLVQVAAEENYISESDIAKVLKFQSNPSDPSWMDL